MRAASRLAFACLALTAAEAAAQKVLIIQDQDPQGTQLLRQVLQGAGMQVDVTPALSYQYGGNPSPMGYDVAILLAGGPGAESANNDMPQGGQQAIADFVSKGGGLILTEWAAFQVSKGRWQILKPLVLLQRSSGTTGFIDYTITPAFANHPIWAGLPQTFQFATATNVGVVLPSPGVVRVAVSKLAGDAVAIRDLIGSGRVVELSTAGNYSPQTWVAPNLQKLIINSVKFASASRINQAPAAKPGGPYTVDEGGMVNLQAQCSDPNGDALTITWDLDGDGVFESNGDLVAFSAAKLDGPSTVTVKVKCSDTGGLADTRSATVNVNNVAPKFTSSPSRQASEGVAYQYKATFVEPYAGDKPACKLDQGPMGMQVDAQCNLNWLPTYDQARGGGAMVAITVFDKDGGQDKQGWSIAVAVIDSDKDTLPDTWEKMYFGDLKQGPGGDPDKDGRPNLKEFQDASDPNKYDGPGAPTPVSPVMDARVGRNPELKINNATNPGGSPMTYEFVSYSDAQLQNVVDVALGIPQGMAQSIYKVKTALAENKHFFWRCRARDTYVAGPWSTVATFFVDETPDPPTVPGLSSPADGTKIRSQRPNLEVTNSKSPDERTLTYEFELFADANMSKKVESKAGVIEGVMGTTAYFVTSELTPYAIYFWRARATDAKGLSSAWSMLWKFQVFPSNPTPSPPTIEVPRNGDRLNTATPGFLFGGSTDLDMEPITYQCDVDTTETFDSPKKQSVKDLKPDAMLKSTWIPAPLDENVIYFLRCRARDTSGSSTWTQAAFLIDKTNDPPSVPTLSNPSMGGMAPGPVVVFTWINSVDPEGDLIRYELEVFRDAGLTAGAGMATGGDGPVGVTVTGLGAGRYFWHARAVDSLGAASAWSEPNEFTVGGFGGPGFDSGCGCRLGAAPARRAPAWLAFTALALALLLLRRRR